MATYLPSIMQTNTLEYDPLPIKTERFQIEDHESEISKWLKLENDPLPPIGNSSSTYNNIFSLPTVVSHTTNGYTSTIPQNANSTSTSSSSENSVFNYMAPSASAPTESHNSSSIRSCPSTHELQDHHYTHNNNIANHTFMNLSSSTDHSQDMENPQSSNISAGFSTFTNSYTTATSQYSSNSDSSTQYSTYSTYPTQYSSCCNSSSSSSYNTPCTTSASTSASSNQMKQFPTPHQPTGFSTHLNHNTNNVHNTKNTNSNTTSTKQPHHQHQHHHQHNTMISPQQYVNVTNGNQHQLYSQFSPANFSSNSLDLQQLATPQLYQLFAQFQQIIKNQSDEINDDKKKRPVRPVVRRVRQTRPKVVEAKGAVQCKGKNRKKGIQCRNAALMEYIGPRPIYCAEHIELDPRSLYEKCKSSYQKDVGDNKGCKEVVLKEFGICYKHYSDLIVELAHKRDVDTIRKHHERIGDLLNQLEKEASAAKKKDGDLYQRKNKLIPKFQEMKKIVNKAVETLDIHDQIQSHSHSHSHHMNSHIHSNSHSSSNHSHDHFMDGLRGKEDADVAPANPDEFMHSHSHDLGSQVFILSEKDVVDAFTDVSDD